MELDTCGVACDGTKIDGLILRHLNSTIKKRRRARISIETFSAGGVRSGKSACCSRAMAAFFGKPVLLLSQPLKC